MNRYNILFTQTFKDTFKYMFGKLTSFSPTYAQNIKNELDDTINLLKIFPYATHTMKFRGDSQIYRKFLVNKRFLIIFKIVNNTIYLLYFIDGRKSPKNYFKIYKD